MNLRIKVLLLVTLATLAACTRVTVFGHTVSQGTTSESKSVPASAPPAAASAAANAPAASASAPVATAAQLMQPGQSPITRLLIDLAPAAQKQSAADPRFNEDALRKALADGLTRRGLANLANDAVVRVAAIELDEFDVRATTNVVLMGRVASVGVLGASVRIRDGSSTQLREFHIRAEMTLNVDRNSKNPLESLYKEFATLIADDLTGTVRPVKPNPLRQ